MKKTISNLIIESTPKSRRSYKQLNVNKLLFHVKHIYLVIKQLIIIFVLKQR